MLNLNKYLVGWDVSTKSGCSSLGEEHTVKTLKQSGETNEYSFESKANDC